MEREIKFRGKTSDEQTFYGDLINHQSSSTFWRLDSLLISL